MSAIFKTKQEQLSQNEIRRQNTQEVGVDHPAAYFLMQLIALVPSDMGFRKVWINPGEPRIDDKKLQMLLVTTLLKNIYYLCLLYSKPNRNNFHRMK